METRERVEKAWDAIAIKHSAGQPFHALKPETQGRLLEFAEELLATQEGDRG